MHSTGTQPGAQHARVGASASPRPVAVIGLGNPLMQDEGIGIRLLDALAQQLAHRTDIDFIDLGTGGMALVHGVSGRRKAVILDCALMGMPPGTIRRFTPDVVRSVKQVDGLSVHDGDALSWIKLARTLDCAPEEAVLFGIEPETISPGTGLSDTLESRIPEYIDTIRHELTRNSPDA